VRKAGLWVQDLWPLDLISQLYRCCLHIDPDSSLGRERHDHLALTAAAFEFYPVGNHPRQ
jgi:hypothetical protein